MELAGVYASIWSTGGVKSVDTHERVHEERSEDHVE